MNIYRVFQHDKAPYLIIKAKKVYFENTKKTKTLLSLGPQVLPRNKLPKKSFQNT